MGTDIADVRREVSLIETMIDSCVEKLLEIQVRR